MQGKTRVPLPYRALLKGLAVILSLVFLGLLVRHLEVGGGLDESWVDSQVRNQGYRGVLLFLAVGSVITGIGWPRQVVAFLGGYAYGVAEGTAWALLASLLGCLLAFYYARWLGRGMILARFPGQVRRLDSFVGEQPFAMTLLIRLLPVGSNLVTNLAAGVSGVRAGPFMAGSALGYVPQTLVFALAGSGISVDPGLRVGLAVVLFLVSGVLGVWLYRHYRHGRSFDEGLDEPGR